MRTENELPQELFDLNNEADVHVKEKIRGRGLKLPEPIRSRYNQVVGDFGHMMMTNSFSKKCAMAISWDVGIREIDILTEINDATICGGLYILLFDDVMDNRGNSQKTPIYDLYLSHLFYLNYLGAIRNISKEKWSSSVLDDVISGETESMVGNYEEEVWHVTSGRAFQDDSLLEHRCSHLKGLVSSILHASSRYDLMEPLSKVINRASFAFCLLDDIADWQEDLARERYTYPIQLCFDRNGIDQSKLTKDEQYSFLLLHLQFGKIYHELMSTICSDLRHLYQKCDELGVPTLGFGFANSLQNCERLWSNHISNLKRVSALAS